MFNKSTVIKHLKIYIRTSLNILKGNFPVDSKEYDNNYFVLVSQVEKI